MTWKSERPSIPRLLLESLRIFLPRAPKLTACFLPYYILGWVSFLASYVVVSILHDGDIYGSPGSVGEGLSGAFQLSCFLFPFSLGLANVSWATVQILESNEPSYFQIVSRSFRRLKSLTLVYLLGWLPFTLMLFFDPFSRFLEQVGAFYLGSVFLIFSLLMVLGFYAFFVTRLRITRAVAIVEDTRLFGWALRSNTLTKGSSFYVLFLFLIQLLACWGMWPLFFGMMPGKGSVSGFLLSLFLLLVFCLFLLLQSMALALFFGVTDGVLYHRLRSLRSGEPLEDPDTLMTGESDRLSILGVLFESLRILILKGWKLLVCILPHLLLSVSIERWLKGRLIDPDPAWFDGASPELLNYFGDFLASLPLYCGGAGVAWATVQLLNSKEPSVGEILRKPFQVFWVLIKLALLQSSIGLVLFLSKSAPDFFKQHEAENLEVVATASVFLCLGLALLLMSRVWFIQAVAIVERQPFLQCIRRAYDLGKRNNLKLLFLVLVVIKLGSGMIVQLANPEGFLTKFVELDWPASPMTWGFLLLIGARNTFQFVVMGVLLHHLLKLKEAQE